MPTRTPTGRPPARRAKALDAARPATKTARLDARVSQEQKALIQRAADLQGRSLTDFIVASLQESAKRAIEEHETIVLNAEASRLFVEALLHPPKPNEALRDAARLHRKLIRDPELDRGR